MKRIASLWWMIVAAFIFLLAPFVAPTIQIGEIQLSRSDANAIPLLVTMGIFGVMLLASVMLVANESRVGFLAVKWWGIVYSIVFLSMLFFLMNVKVPIAWAVMAAFSIAWYWGASRDLKRTTPNKTIEPTR